MRIAQLGIAGSGSWRIAGRSQGSHWPQAPLGDSSPRAVGACWLPNIQDTKGILRIPKYTHSKAFAPARLLGTSRRVLGIAGVAGHRPGQSCAAGAMPCLALDPRPATTCQEPEGRLVRAPSANCTKHRLVWLALDPSPGRAWQCQAPRLVCRHRHALPGPRALRSYTGALWVRKAAVPPTAFARAALTVWHPRAVPRTGPRAVPPWGTPCPASLGSWAEPQAPACGLSRALRASPPFGR